jgi:hypothetical protein
MITVRGEDMIKEEEGLCDAEPQQIMNETIDVLRSFYAGECEDVTEKVLNGEEF